MLKINEDYKPEGIAPLYMHYSGQTNAQPAYLKLTDKGQVDVGYSSAIDNSIPVDIYNGVDMQWAIPNDLSVQGINNMIQELRPLLEKLYKNHIVKWDGSNFKGKEIGDNDYEGQIDKIINDNEWDRVDIWEAAEWYQNEIDHLREQYAEAGDKKLFMADLQERASEDRTYLDKLDELEDQLSS